MTETSIIKLTINFVDPELDEEERDGEVKMLLLELTQMSDEIESVYEVPDPNPPVRGKALGGTLVGLLTAEVSIANIKALFRFLGDRLSGKPIELEVEANGRKLKVSAHSRQELEAAIKAAEEFIRS